MDRRLWKLDLDDPCILSAMREVLEIRFQQHIWLTASAEHCAPLGEKPDITAYNILRKDYTKHAKHRHSYFLEAVVQGAAL